MLLVLCVCVFQRHLWAHSVHQQEPLGVRRPRGRLLSDQRGERRLLFYLRNALRDFPQVLHDCPL